MAIRGLLAHPQSVQMRVIYFLLAIKGVHLRRGSSMLECSSGEMHTSYSFGARLNLAECSRTAVLRRRLEFASCTNSAGGSDDSDASPAPKSDTGRLVVAREDRVVFPALGITPVVVEREYSSGEMHTSYSFKRVGA